MSEDWFRRRTWTDADRTEFLTRLRRSRTAFHKAQYARIQALELHQSGGISHAANALALLDMIVECWMEHADRASVHQQRAECLRDMGRDAEAIAAYRETFAEQRRRRNHLTNAHIDFAWWIATVGKADLFDEALDVLDEFSREDGVRFPANVYLSEGARALIRRARGEERLASDHARRALAAAGTKSSGLRYHPALGLVQIRDAHAHALLTSLASG